MHAVKDNTTLEAARRLRQRTNVLKHSILVTIALAIAFASSSAESRPGPGAHELSFSNWAGPAITVRAWLPEAASDNTPVVIVMHGASRDLPRYFADWSAVAEASGFILVVPWFSKDDFPTSARYNLGHVFDAETGAPREESLWTFSAIEPLFDHVVRWAGVDTVSYTLYGHSAGSQFVHRFLYFKPDARVARAIVANAGWYTMPDFGVDFPYGLDNSGLQTDVLSAFFSRDVVVLLGDADTKVDEDNLRRTPEAMLQGAHRLQRGRTFFRVAEARAAEIGSEFNWRLQTVPGAEHSNAQMTPAAAALVR